MTFSFGEIGPTQSYKVTVARGSDSARFGPIFFQLLLTGSAWILPTQYRKVCINGQSMELLQCFFYTVLSTGNGIAIS